MLIKSKAINIQELLQIDDKLQWDEHASNTYKKANKRVYFLRKLNEFHIDPVLISLFYQATIQSILTFCIIGWGGNTNQNQRNKIDSLIKRSGKLFKKSPLSFDDLFDVCCARKIKSIDKDASHPLFSQIVRSTRTDRIQLILAKTERYKLTFMPHAIKFLQVGR